MNKDELSSRLMGQVAGGQELEGIFNNTTEVKSRYYDWEDYNVALLERAFDNNGNWLTTTPVSEYRRISLPIVDLALDRTAGIAGDRIDQIKSNIAEKCRYMKALSGRLDLYEPSDKAASSEVTG